MVGPSAVVNLLFNFEDMITREKITKLWNDLYSFRCSFTFSFLKNHIWTHRVVKRMFLWSYMYLGRTLLSYSRREKDPDFSIDRHIVEINEPKTHKDVKIFFQEHVNVYVSLLPF